MNKLTEYFKTLKEKWNNLSKKKRIVIILLTSGIIFSSIILFVYLNRVTYATLFSNLEPQDSEKIITKLNEDKIQYKIKGNSILVPEEKVDELRMTVLSDGYMPSSGKGFELFDEGKFGVTDSEARIMYQRALEGELARTIESFEEVEKARVHLVMPQETVFTRDTDKATASVTLKLKATNTLSPEQVKAIVALVSGSVKNLPKENVEVIDSNMNLLSENLFNDISPTGTVSALKQQEYEKQFENGLQNDLKKMLENVFGAGRVSVKVNADLDFDSKEITTIKYDKDSIVRSQHKIKENASDSLGKDTGNSPIDNNTSNNIVNSGNQSSNSNREEETTNYEIGETKENVVKAPGEVRRMTVSVVIDGNLSFEEKQSIQNIVAAATGYNQERGDTINIEALAFNQEAKKKLESDLAAMQKQEEYEKKKKFYIQVGAASAALILLVIALIIYRRKKNNEDFEEDKPSHTIDLMVGDNIVPKQSIAYEPILDDNDEGMTLEQELKNYANKKPEQVAEVIKTWLAEDER
ncbi:flagellar M-ring protein FliF [Fervidicella metallireducens AeB]|uniref:Flagellar M-ring protein n=1 Tax=Fervidicella metallireducens AeB TaxID=1403537 RepID=A0A017RVI8_9CLOT|nr:flagellar basal-body MS-ring/collar protein FliF [Fervidicella metallireducens]EYE88798.1 flagellar M-ring protein FliF [Fervidicella metallireducens AeB]